MNIVQRREWYEIPGLVPLIVLSGAVIAVWAVGGLNIPPADAPPAPIPGTEAPPRPPFAGDDDYIPGEKPPVEAPIKPRYN
jgi:hypothetical protein